MKNCLFCKIIKGEIPSTKVYEDENIFAFLDINPNNIGHTLVIPKKHSRNILDIEERDLKNVIMGVQKISQAIKKAVSADGINVMNNNEPVAGQVIFHTHFHIIPRFESDGYKHWKGKTKYAEGEAEQVAEKIRKEI
ncbi:MAG: HIT family protein [Candidatus Pacebacteria bacterium]|nr:HIT family protein [Candidatus Paceibacterota bacterium]